MSVKDEYLAYRDGHGLKTGVFVDRVALQQLLRDRLEAIWSERPQFSNGGLLSNYMTGLALGFAYYDCRPSGFCKSRCYGLPIAGLHDYYMLRLGVITSEALKTGDQRFLIPLVRKLHALRPLVLKIGHWGDAVPQQVQHVAGVVQQFPATKFWWYTRKLEVALAGNKIDLPNLRVYLSLDPTTVFPRNEEYPYGITYLFGDSLRHTDHAAILADPRLVAVFPLKVRSHVEENAHREVVRHPRLCIEKDRAATHHSKGEHLCYSCSGRCNFAYAP